jgi:hypothetical protein
VAEAKNPQPPAPDLDEEDGPTPEVLAAMLEEIERRVAGKE